MTREQWWDVMGDHISLPITIIDRRKNQYDAQYSVRVIRKGNVLVTKVCFRYQVNNRRFLNQGNMF